jgi:catechol 2,3-dioxygenase-like lactoylglutathione lyase family enzyme
MPLELYMVGLIVRDMPAALAFYRRLGLAIPADSDTKPHVQIKMGALTFFLDAQPGRWDPEFGAQPHPQPAPPANQYPLVLEFYLKEPAALDAKYAELTGCGYEGFRQPYLTPFGMYFAMVRDPDGNTILLSADAPPS